MRPAVLFRKDRRRDNCCKIAITLIDRPATPLNPFLLTERNRLILTVNVRLARQ